MISMRAAVATLLGGTSGMRETLRPTELVTLAVGTDGTGLALELAVSLCASGLPHPASRSPNSSDATSFVLKLATQPPPCNDANNLYMRNASVAPKVPTHGPPIIGTLLP